MGADKFFEFLKSDTFGFYFKVVSGLAATVFGMLGIGTKTREDNGKLTRNGKIALTGIIVSGICALGSSVYEFTTSQERGREEREKSQRLMLSVQRGIYPLRDLKMSVEISLDRDFIGLAEYKKSLK